jgi:hypothetical protein
MVSSGDDVRSVALNTHDPEVAGVTRIGRDPALVPGAVPNPGTYGQRAESADAGVSDEQTAPGSDPGAWLWPSVDGEVS